jgi:UDP-glucose 4-epimerase
LNILVTGGAGYIGSVILELLAKHTDHAVIAVDNLSDGNRQSIPAAVRFYQGDIGDAALLHNIFASENIDVVIHLAASSSVPDSVINPIEYYQNNIVNTITMLEAMLKHNVRGIIFSSSAAVYGEPQSVPIAETHPTIPVNPYGHTKLFTERLLNDLAVSGKIDFVALRFFCAAGATADHGESRKAETHLIPVILDYLLGKGVPVKIYGNTFPTPDGSGIRDYVHVCDIARAHILSLEHFDAIKNTVFNISTNSGYSVLEVVRAVEKIFSVHIPFTIEEPRPGDPAMLTASSERIREAIGWETEHDLESIIRSAYEWRKNPKY